MLDFFSEFLFCSANWGILPTLSTPLTDLWTQTWCLVLLVLIFFLCVLVQMLIHLDLEIDMTSLPCVESLELFEFLECQTVCFVIFVWHYWITALCFGKYVLCNEHSVSFALRREQLHPNKWKYKVQINEATKSSVYTLHRRHTEYKIQTKFEHTEGNTTQPLLTNFHQTLSIKLINPTLKCSLIQATSTNLQVQQPEAAPPLIIWWGEKKQ